MSKISIIIPVYNAENYLKRCIESLINQTYTNIEIILVNDGSTDSSLKICKEYQKKDNRILLFNKENEGVSFARNHGLNHATGDYIGFVDSDDYVGANMYQILVDNIESHNADIVECGFSRVKNEHKVEEILFNQKEYSNNQDIYYSIIKRENTVNSVCNKLYKKYLFRDIRFNKFSYSEDFFINMKIALLANKKIVIPDILYFYNLNNDGASLADFSKNKLDKIYAREILYKEFYKLNDQKLLELISLDILKVIVECEKDLEKSKNINKYHFLKIFNEKFDRYIINLNNSHFF